MKTFHLVLKSGMKYNPTRRKENLFGEKNDGFPMINVLDMQEYILRKGKTK